MMKRVLLAAAAATAVLAVTPAAARQGCGIGGHRDFRGWCVPNRRPPAVAVPGPVIGVPRAGIFYADRGWWDGSRYWPHRHWWHGHWRYR